MMDWSNRHYRYFMRQISAQARLVRTSIDIACRLIDALQPTKSTEQARA